MFLQIICSPVRSERRLGAGCWARGEEALLPLALPGQASSWETGKLFILRYTLVQRLWEHRRRRCLRKKSCRRIQEMRAFHGADPETHHGEATYRKNQSEVENRVLPSTCWTDSLLEHTLDHTAGVCK